MSALLKILVVTMAFCVFPTHGRAATTMTLQTANDLFAAGNAFYRGQNFEAAREAYQQLLNAGYDTAPVLYNLGTAEARMGSATQALAHLARAEKQRPRDGNIQANIAFVKKAPVQSLNTTANELVVRESIWSRIYGFLTAREWLALLWMGLMAACTGGVLLFFARNARLHSIAHGLVLGGAGFMALVTIPAATQYYQSRVVQSAIVVSPAELLSGPAQRFTRIANLTQGQIVRNLKGSEKDYLHVKLDNGLHGYVKSDALLEM